MSKADPVDHNLALVRAATAPPRAAKARVRGALAHTLPAVRRAAAGPAPRSAAWKGLGLLGAGLVAGYCLGLGQVGLPGRAGAPSGADVPALSAAEHPAPPAVLRGDTTSPASPQPSPPRSEPQTAPDPGSTASESAVADAHAGASATPARAAAQRRRSRPNGADLSNGSPRSNGPGLSQSTSVAELMLLSRAERAVRAADGALALAFIRQLEQDHPRTRFGEERQALRVLAECLLGEAQAQARAATFLEARPSSVYSDRIERLCLGKGTSTSSASADGSADGAH